MKTASPDNFSWVDHEIRGVATRKFFKTSDPSSANSLAEFESRTGPLADDYRRFLLSFGGVELFRNPERDEYALALAKNPSLAHSDGELQFVSIGMRDGRSVYLVAKSGGQIDTSVLEHKSSGGIETVGESFSQWLRSSFYRQKSKYSHREWVEILNGPVPFTERELQLVQARRQWEVRKLGTDAKGNLLLEISNHSSESFRYITVHIRSDGLRAHVPVRVENLGPGSTWKCPINFYKDIVRSDDAEIIPLVDIGPEDRNLLFELTGPRWFRKRLSDGRPMGSELV